MCSSINWILLWRLPIQNHTKLSVTEKRINGAKYLTWQCRTQSIFGDTVYSCYCKFKLLTPPPWWGLRGRKFLILTTLDRWKRHFREQNYIENCFYLLKSTKHTKTTSKNVEEILYGGIFWAPIPVKRYQNTSGVVVAWNSVRLKFVKKTSISSWTARVARELLKP